MLVKRIRTIFDDMKQQEPQSKLLDIDEPVTRAHYKQYRVIWQMPERGLFTLSKVLDIAIIARHNESFASGTRFAFVFTNFTTY